jgi:hypothetical protein
MIRGVLTRVQRSVFRKPASQEETQQAATAERQSRSDVILGLWADISKLQHEIKNLSDAQDATASGDARAILGGRLAALEAELARTQRDLSRFQGRV